MIDVESTLGHHLFQVAVAERIAQIPAHAQQNDLRLRYLPDNRKIGKSDMKPLDKPLEIILKKTTEKHVKSTDAVIAL